MLPIIHIDHLAKELGVERRWIMDNWLKRVQADDSAGPVPHFRDGHNVFFDLEELHLWARRRSFGSDFTDMPIDPSG